MERVSFFQTQANTTLLSTNDPELQWLCPGFGEYLPCPAALLKVSHRANEWPFYSSGGVPWPPETENFRQGKPNVRCWQFSLFLTGENNKDNMVHPVAPKQWETLALCCTCSGPRGWPWLGASPQASAELHSGWVEWASVCSTLPLLGLPSPPWRDVRYRLKVPSRPGYCCFPYGTPWQPGTGGIFRLIHIY